MSWSVLRDLAPKFRRGVRLLAAGPPDRGERWVGHAVESGGNVDGADQGLLRHAGCDRRARRGRRNQALLEVSMPSDRHNPFRSRHPVKTNRPALEGPRDAVHSGLPCSRSDHRKSFAHVAVCIALCAHQRWIASWSRLRTVAKSGSSKRSCSSCGSSSRSKSCPFSWSLNSTSL